MKSWLTILALVALGAAACDSTPPPRLCDDVPAGGCPLSNGVACEDPTCQAVYACNDGVWSFDHACPTVDAGIVDATVDADADEMPAFDAASIDAPPGSFGGPGCTDLEAPDCPLGEAIVCGPGCCDCEELYVCVDMGWTDWGSCSPDGGIVQYQ
jgi:hypothetical protein